MWKKKKTKVDNENTVPDESDQLTVLLKNYIVDGHFPQGECKISAIRREKGRITTGEVARPSLREIEDIGMFDFLRENFGGADYRVKVSVNNGKALVPVGEVTYKIFGEKVSEETTTDQSKYEKLIDRLVTSFLDGQVDKKDSKYEKIVEKLIDKQLTDDPILNATRTIQSIKDIDGIIRPAIPIIDDATGANAWIQTILGLTPSINALTAKFLSIGTRPERSSAMAGIQTERIALPSENIRDIANHASETKEPVDAIKDNVPDEDLTIIDDKEIQQEHFEILFLLPIETEIGAETPNASKIAQMLFGAVTHTHLFLSDNLHPLMKPFEDALNDVSMDTLTEAYYNFADYFRMDDTLTEGVKTELMALIDAQQQLAKGMNVDQPSI